MRYVLGKVQAAVHSRETLMGYRRQMTPKQLDKQIERQRKWYALTGDKDDGAVLARLLEERIARAEQLQQKGPRP